MANRCNNKVTFKGNQASLNQVSDLFRTMIDNESKGKIGQLPDFIQSEYGYFSEIYKDETEECSFHYDTRWSPNIEVLWTIANHFDVEFVLSYEESGCMLLGKTFYENEILKDYCLNQSDFQDCSYNEEENNYQFEGNIYEYKDEIMKILLGRKIAFGQS
ncbi:MULTISPECIES: hypothetical protein [Chryseobacterium]|uniref:YubB ferredoxin-like domain-containing protein n=2 Tax=Flavobacteriales TaxID=200644 RepID=A0A3G6T7W4_9FLAO|nr:hypothetical protein [Chryseobacterium bernardetii]AZB25278.1 hypothetical protein EG339_12165 [Chryseobacterium bernardetii]